MNDDIDPDLQELKNTYSFNESLLKNCFTDEGQNVFQKYQLLAKIHNILIFRKKYETKFKFPQILFTFNNKVEEGSTINKSIIGYFCSLSKLNQSEIHGISSKIGSSLEPSIDLQNFSNINNNISNQNPNDLNRFDITDLLIGVFLITQSEINNNNTDKNEETCFNLKDKYNWIIDYFVYSTFPSLFGHFCSIEYLREGLSFISLLINDNIAPRLVGSFLHHSFLFKDRILIQFFCMISKRIDCKNESNSYLLNDDSDLFSLDSIESMFFEAFSSCMSYFSIYHFKAIDLLRKVRGDDVAIEAIWDYFLLDEFVDNWEYSPLFSSLHVNQSFLMEKQNHLKQPETENLNGSIYERIFPKYRNILSCILHQISDEKIKEKQMKYVNLFSTKSNLDESDNDDVIYFNMPKISDIIFFKGIVFAITKLDLNLGHILRTFFKQISSLSTSISTDSLYESIASAIINYPGIKIASLTETQLAYNSVNILLRLTHIFPNQEIFPSPPDPNKSTIFDRLMYNKDVHNILYKRSGGLVTAKSFLGSIEKSIILESSSYANELFQKNMHEQTDSGSKISNFNAAYYGEMQRRLFVLQIVEMIVNSIECFAQFINSVLGSEFPNALGGDVSNILKVKLSEEWTNVEEKKFYTKQFNSNDSLPKEEIKTSTYSLSSSESSVSDFSSLSLDIVSKSLIDTAEKIINSWKFVYNGNIEMDQNSNQQKLSNSELKMEFYQPVTGIFVFVTNEITKSLIYITLSYVPHPIIPQSNSNENDQITKERENALYSIVNSKSLRVPFLDSNLSLSFCLADPYISFYIDVTHDVQCFLLLLEKSFQNEFCRPFKSNSSNIEFYEQYNIGWKLQTFIQLEKMLNPILNNAKLNQNTIKMLITALFNGNDPFYIRLNLINVSRVVKSLCTLNEDPVRRYSSPSPHPKNVSNRLKNGKNILIQKVEDEKIVGRINSLLIFDIFGQEVVDKFKNLQRWFSLIESV